ncbi:hypothetical protein ACCS93_35975 [Rhizobium ruizarguesonis]
MECDLRPAMNVCVFQDPNGAWLRKRWPLGDHPERFVNFVFIDVSSIKVSRDNALLKNGFPGSSNDRVLVRFLDEAARLPADFFMAQPEPVQHPADRGTMRIDTWSISTADMALSSRQERTCLSLQPRWRDASRCPFPSSTNAITRERNSIGWDFPMTILLPIMTESQVDRFGNLNQKIGNRL